MRTILLKHLDGREFARLYDPHSAGATVEAVCEEFECFEDDITFEENEEGELILIDDKPSAQVTVSYSKDSSPIGRALEKAYPWGYRSTDKEP